MDSCPKGYKSASKNLPAEQPCHQAAPRQLRWCLPPSSSLALCHAAEAQRIRANSHVFANWLRHWDHWAGHKGGQLDLCWFAACFGNVRERRTHGSWGWGWDETQRAQAMGVQSAAPWSLGYATLDGEVSQQAREQSFPQYGYSQTCRSSPSALWLLRLRQGMPVVFLSTAQELSRATWELLPGCSAAHHQDLSYLLSATLRFTQPTFTETISI